MAGSPNRYDLVDEKSGNMAASGATLAPPGQANPLSPTDSREAASRLTDDLELIRAERAVSNREHEQLGRAKTRRQDSDEPFTQRKDTEQKPKNIDENALAYRFWRYLKKFPRFIRYFLYMLPGAGLLLIPVLLSEYTIEYGTAPVGGSHGVRLKWFGIWLMVVWCSLWGSRMVTSFMPYAFRLGARIMGATNPKKWKDIGRQMELHTALFIWLLAVLASFLPIVNGKGHRVNPEEDELQPLHWIDVVNKVIISLFILATLNFVEKICIQWIATSFHQRTYASRIETNKNDTQNLVHLYEYATARISREDSIWQSAGGGVPSGARTPMQAFQTAFNKFGAAANKVGNDFIGRKTDVHHPRKVVTELLRATPGAHTLARLIYRSLVSEGKDTVYLEDMITAFKGEQEMAETAFSMFDKDLNNDISMEEFEAVCNEIHLEKKAIAASLKDLDSVIQKLDKVFVVIILFIAAIVFISILSNSAAAGLASASTFVLGLAWMLQATAQEFLQSIIFVFVKHPFDVGDRVTVYGNTGSQMKGDDYYVTEISLLYTEFKKMEGHIVQAPNSLLNTLFILNMRRSNGLADVVELKMRFGTPGHMIEDLKERMLSYCLENKRDYQPRIITEVRTLDEVRAVTVNFIFFHKTNFQNELVRLTRHNKFCAELMSQMVNIGIQGPYRGEPGGSRDIPLYWSTMPAPPQYNDGYQPVPSMQPPPTPQAYHRKRSDTHSSLITPIVEDHLGDFQDVFESRKGEGSSRLGTIKERKPADIPEEGSSTALEKVDTRESQGGSSKRLFGRPRSKSKSNAGKSSAEIV